MGRGSLPNAENSNPSSQRSNFFLFPEVVELCYDGLLNIPMPGETFESPFPVIILVI